MLGSLYDLWLNKLEDVTIPIGVLWDTHLKSDWNNTTAKEVYKMLLSKQNLSSLGECEFKLAKYIDQVPARIIRDAVFVCLEAIASNLTKHKKKQAEYKSFDEDMVKYEKAKEKYYNLSPTKQLNAKHPKKPILPSNEFKFDQTFRKKSMNSGTINVEGNLFSIKLLETRPFLSVFPTILVDPIKMSGLPKCLWFLVEQKKPNQCGMKIHFKDGRYIGQFSYVVVVPTGNTQHPLPFEPLPSPESSGLAISAKSKRNSRYTAGVHRNFVPNRPRKIVSIDPGARTFLYWYSPDGSSGTFGTGSGKPEAPLIQMRREAERKSKQVAELKQQWRDYSAAINPKHLKMPSPPKPPKNISTPEGNEWHEQRLAEWVLRKDLITEHREKHFRLSRERASKTRNRVKKKTRLAIIRAAKAAKVARTKLENQVKDIHYKTANFLCSSFTDILLPKLSTGSMVRRDNGLAKQTRIAFQVLRHKAFINRLLHVADRFPDVIVHKTSEWGTTKLCGSCLRKNDPGRSELYECSNCTFTAHRDGNSARLISLVNLRPLK
jgi:transposase